MANGRPVVGCSVGGIPEMVVHEETGLLVPPRSPELLAVALARLLRDAAARQRFGYRARKRCEELFSLKAHADSVLNGYTQVHRGTKLVEVA
jgi:glycosyltransferase involved in cell wall biosynthesis